MIYTPLTRKAMNIAYAAHHGQLDKAGVPYIFHPIHLAEQMTDELSCVCALLHDVMEDTPTTAQMLLEAGIPQQAVDVLLLLTHDPAEDYMDYVRRIKRDPTARAVKLADLAHNSDVTRVDVIDEKMRARHEKYREAVRILSE